TAAVMFVSVCILLLIKYLPQPQKSGLSEVEILQESGYIVTVNGSNSAAQPVDGWEEYQQYVDQHYSNTEDLQGRVRSEEHTSELQSRENLVCRLLLEKKKKN